jgi:hypothetical protein
MHLPTAGCRLTVPPQPRQPRLHPVAIAARQANLDFVLAPHSLSTTHAACLVALCMRCSQVIICRMRPGRHDGALKDNMQRLVRRWRRWWRRCRMFGDILRRLTTQQAAKYVPHEAHGRVSLPQAASMWLVTMAGIQADYSRGAPRHGQFGISQPTRMSHTASSDLAKSQRFNSCMPQARI